jgi:CRISPR type I-E-associated protein CasB/Cse2
MINVKTERDLAWACQVWWRNLNGIDKGGKEDRDRADRKARAELRRAGSVASSEGDAINLIRAFGIERFHALKRSVEAKAAWIDADNVALAAIALAHVERDSAQGEDTAAQKTAGLLGEGDPPCFAEARLKRLIRTDKPAELLPQIVRAVKILGKAAPVGDLGASLLLWGPEVKKRWAFAYWLKKYIPAEAPTEPSEQAA